MHAYTQRKVRSQAIAAHACTEGHECTLQNTKQKGHCSCIERSAVPCRSLCVQTAQVHGIPSAAVDTSVSASHPPANMDSSATTCHEEEDQDWPQSSRRRRCKRIREDVEEDEHTLEEAETAFINDGKEGSSKTSAIVEEAPSYFTRVSVSSDACTLATLYRSRTAELSRSTYILRLSEQALVSCRAGFRTHGWRRLRV